ncbi:MAG: hypothetical protein IPM55_10845 [Acidobacteria bacterium]|nr:hypothetical protein [Acidobacteriota bacterium]
MNIAGKVADRQAGEAQQPSLRSSMGAGGDQRCQAGERTYRRSRMRNEKASRSSPDRIRQGYLKIGPDSRQPGVPLALLSLKSPAGGVRSSAKSNLRRGIGRAVSSASPVRTGKRRPRHSSGELLRGGGLPTQSAKHRHTAHFTGRDFARRIHTVAELSSFQL